MRPGTRDAALRGGLDRFSNQFSVPCSQLYSFLEFELRLVLFEKLSEFVGRLEQALPLLVVQGHWEAAQPIHAHATFFADAEFQSAGAAWTLFQFRQAGF